MKRLDDKLGLENLTINDTNGNLYTFKTFQDKAEAEESAKEFARLLRMNANGFFCQALRNLL